MYLDVSDSNGSVLNFFVNVSAMFSSELTKSIFNVVSSMWSRMNWWRMSVCFVCWYYDVFSDKNTAPMLSTCTIMVYSTTTLVNNKTNKINIILQHTSVIAEYSVSVTDSVTIFKLRKHQVMNAPIIWTIYLFTVFQVSLSPA